MLDATIVAIAKAVEAVAVMTTEIVKGQPAEVKAEIWRQHLADLTRFRKLIGLGDGD
jgi:hypothetical protein